MTAAFSGSSPFPSPFISKHIPVTMPHPQPCGVCRLVKDFACNNIIVDNAESHVHFPLTDKLVDINQIYRTRVRSGW